MVAKWIIWCADRTGILILAMGWCCLGKVDLVVREVGMDEILITDAELHDEGILDQSPIITRQGPIGPNQCYIYFATSPLNQHHFCVWETLEGVKKRYWRNVKRGWR